MVVIGWGDGAKPGGPVAVLPQPLGQQMLQKKCPVREPVMPRSLLFALYAVPTLVVAGLPLALASRGAGIRLSEWRHPFADLPIVDKDGKRVMPALDSRPAGLTGADLLFNLACGISMCA